MCVRECECVCSKVGVRKPLSPGARVCELANSPYPLGLGLSSESRDPAAPSSEQWPSGLYQHSGLQ